MVALVISLGGSAVLAGLIAIAFGIPINEFGLGNTLILAGTTILSAGLIVLALAAILRAVLQMGGEATIADTRAASPAERRAAPSEWPRPKAVASARMESEPRERAETPAPARPDWSGMAEEGAREEPQAPMPRAAPPLRGERNPPPITRPPLRPERAGERTGETRMPRAGFQAPEPSPADAPMAPAPEPAPGPETQQPERRRLFAWTRRSSSGRETVEPTTEPIESGTRVEPALGPARGERWEERPDAAYGPEDSPAAHQAEDEPAEQVKVLKSGTVGGMAYTLYTDGSIDAEFVEGKIRFASIDELRQHLEERG